MNKFLKWFLKWFFNQDDERIDDISVDTAKANYQKYQEELNAWKEFYIKKICADINKASRSGSLYLYVDDIPEELETRAFIQEIKEYFEARGFAVELRHFDVDFMQTTVKIMWE